MNGLIFLLCCIEILGALLCGAEMDYTMFDDMNLQNPSTTELKFEHTESTSPTSQIQTHSAPSVPSIEVATVTQAFEKPTASRSPSPKPTTTSTASSTTIFQKRECLPVYIVAGGLIIACTILLISTLTLIWKVCQLNRHIKLLSNSVDLIGDTEYWVGTAKKSKSASETEVKEMTVLMSDINQTVEDVSNGDTKKEEVEGDDGGQTGGENKEEVGETTKSEEVTTTPGATVQDESSSKPQEDTDCHSNKAEEASP